MNKLTLALIVFFLILVATVTAWLSLDAGGGRQDQARPVVGPAGAVEAPAAQLTAAPGKQNPEETAGATRPADRQALTVEAPTERYGDWSDRAEVWIEGVVAIPPGMEADPDLRVLALSKEISPRDLYGADGLVRRLKRVDPEDPPAHVLATKQVEADGSFRIPFPANEPDAHLVVSGRYLYSKAATRVTVAQPELVQLEPMLGGCLIGQVLIPEGMDRELVFGDLRVQVEIDPTQFSMLDSRTEWLFDRGADVDAAGRFVVPAIETSRPYEVQIDSDHLAAYSEQGLTFDDGRALELEAKLVRGATARGRVLDENGEPVAQARVACTQTVMWGFPGGSLSETKTDADGSFELERIPPGTATLIAKLEGFLDSSPTSFEAEDESAVDDLALVIEAGNDLAGIVRWDSGKPVAEAAVSVRFDPEAMMGMQAMNAARGARGKAATDANGRFEVHGLGKGPFLVTASIEMPGDKAGATTDGEGRLWQARKSGVLPDSLDLEFILERPPVITGRVIDLAGAPVEEFEITSSNQGAVFWMPGETNSKRFDNPDGSFVLDELTPGTWEISARADGFGRSELAQLIVPADSYDPLLFTVAPAGGATGIVQDAFGAPISGAKVTITVESNKTFARMTGELDLPETYSDEEGTFLLEDLTPGMVGLVASHPDFAASLPSTHEILPGQIVDEVLLSLRQGGRLTGEIFDKEGGPMVGGQVFVQDMTTFATIMRRTDASGFFEVDRLTPGNWNVTAMLGTMDPGGGVDGEEADPNAFMENMRFTGVEIKEGEESHVVLGAPPSDPVVVTGRITHAGEPVGGTMISFMPEDAGGLQDMRMQQVGADGMFEVELGKPGGYLVQVQKFGEAGGFQQNNVEFSRTIPEDVERHQMDLQLPVASISGQVLDSRGRALGGARVTLTIDGGIAYGTFMGGNYAESTTSADGTYIFEFLRPGSYSVAAGGSMLGGAFGTHSNQGRMVRDGIQVGEGAHVDGEDFHLGEAGEISGSVVDVAGIPVHGAAIFVRDERGRLLERFSMITTGSDGTFRYTGVAPGRYTVDARTSGLVSSSDEIIDVRAGEVASTKVTLGEGTMLLVTVIDRSGANVSARVSISDSRGREVNGMISYAEIMQSFGEFNAGEQRVGPLAPDRYTVHARTDDGREVKKPVNLTGQAERRLKIRLK